MAAEQERDLREVALSDESHLQAFVALAGDQTAVRESVSSPILFPHLRGLRPDLYRCFMEQTWGHQSSSGITALIHYETHFTDEKAGLLRRATYSRLRRHWHFVNELSLFEMGHKKQFGVNVYGSPAGDVNFLSACWIYHPDTIERSLIHDGSGDPPGLKHAGSWDLRPHAERIVRVDSETLLSWQSIMEDAAVPAVDTRMVFTVNRSTADVLQTLTKAPRLGEAGFEFSPGWNEKTDFDRGIFTRAWGEPTDWSHVIMQGVHLFVSTPIYKVPNETMRGSYDWSEVDLEALSVTAIPVTTYKPALQTSPYLAEYTKWGHDRSVPATSQYRVAWRNMADPFMERTLIPAVIPPGAAHVDGVFSLGSGEGRLRELSMVAGIFSSLVSDFLVRVAPKSTIRSATARRLPWLGSSPVDDQVLLRTLRLNCLTSAYVGLWHDVVGEMDVNDSWTGGIDYPGRPALGDVTATWTPAVPLRRASDRRQALVEIDALVALMLGLTADELCTIYRTQFAVLYGYDRSKYVYDTNGREVPTSVLQTWRKRGLDETSREGLTQDERTATNASGNTYVYGLPFRTLDREDDMRTAYAHFEKLMAERTAAEPSDG